jgi:hypothetical protein
MGFKVVFTMEHYKMNVMGAKVELNGIKNQFEIINNNKHLKFYVFFIHNCTKLNLFTFYFFLMLMFFYCGNNIDSSCKYLEQTWSKVQGVENTIINVC